MRALVVEDELAVQRLLVRSLIQQGFQCDTATDGNEAEQRASKVRYDVVITDLKMPNRHGHALAVYLLTLKSRPAIIVHTGVVEPKLAKDLLARGVDDIVFKPFDFHLLAIKAKALAERRLAPGDGLQKQPVARKGESPSTAPENVPVRIPISLASIESRLSGLSRILPISSAGLDVYNMTRTDAWETSQIAAAIQRDATLAAEVLQLANSAFYNTSGQRVVQLERAVVQIGQKRIGEVALATNALASLAHGLVPWMNVGLTWKRSMAAGLAVEMLIAEGKYQQNEQGLLLSAIMHPLGRVIMGTLYPKQYDAMVEACQAKHETLFKQERAMFAINHAEATALLLASWGIPADIHLPLKHLFADSTSLGKVPEATSKKVELLRLAITLGNVAIGEWETWDSVEVPSDALLRKLDGKFITGIIRRIKSEIEQLAVARKDRPGASKPHPPTPASHPLKELAYCDFSGSSLDFLGETISSMGVKLVKYTPEDLNDGKAGVLVNCVGIAPHRFAERAGRAARQTLTIVTEAERVEKYGDYGQVLALPISYGRLRAVCLEAPQGIMQPQ